MSEIPTISGSSSAPPEAGTAGGAVSPAPLPMPSKQVGVGVSSKTKADPTAARLAAQQIRRRLRADQNGALIAGGIMAGTGWVLLYRLVTGSLPLAFPRWLFFILLYVAITGTIMPLVWYLNQRFSRYRPATGGVILRQSMWFGMFAVVVAWLQMTRALSAPIAFFLGLAMLVIETFLRIRERG
ncbi:MAG: hypothetical protein IAE83_13845 [Anaerolinea sp.]|mgnify:CR=1 FL=1|nr:hypothetical protein [Anaerolinea sp.]MCC6974667.1 hypothetical protein [Anaerolineae bacterium]CAG0970279.1 hypothetical protein ANRL4_01208 [Anaerolineae bacterium]